MYKIYTNSALQKFECLFECNKDVHDYNTRQTNHYNFPCVRTNLGNLASDIKVPLFGMKY